MEPFFKIKTFTSLKEVIQPYFISNNIKSHKKVTGSFFGIENFKTVMMSFFCIKNLKSRGNVMEFFFSINNFKSRQKVTGSFFRC